MSIMEQLPLTHDQQRIFDVVEKTNRNILICGKPGTGKTVLERALLEFSQKRWTMCAPTGLAAINGGGKTLHSVFGIPVSQGIFTPDYNQFTTFESIVKHLTHGVKHLIIDEVSMVRADTFDYIDRVLRHFKGIDEPFGGIQVVLVGDFYQLPPVVVGPEVRQMKEHYASPFAFSSRAFDEGNFQILELTEVLRQKGDDRFIKILHSARTGEVTDKQLDVLNTRVKPKVDDIRIRLAGTNKEADIVNHSMLGAIDSPEKIFPVNEFGRWPEKADLVPLRLKVGAQVMVTVNKADLPQGAKGDGQTVNGSLGTVVEMAEQQVTVLLDNGVQVPVYRKRREHRVKELVDGRYQEVLKASIDGLPLKLAWAISIHKSQGQSFDKVHVDAAKIFAAGQLYVALSRARSLEGLTLARKLNEAMFFADEKVEEFFSNLVDK